ncbi:MAG: hypothetical protein ABI620_10510, partial [Chloroflexota bacterium]
GMSREMGRRLEPNLFEAWGGKPSTQLLRHRNSTIDSVTKKRYHTFLATKINTAFPDEAQEKANPIAADEVYQSAIRWLLNSENSRTSITWHSPPPSISSLISCTVACLIIVLEISSFA